MSTTGRIVVEQLDLFAEIEAAADQRAFDQAPSIYDTATRGYFNRLDDVASWAERHGHFESNMRSHAWRAACGSPDARDAAQDDHRPAVLTADLRCHGPRTRRPGRAGSRPSPTPTPLAGSSPAGRSAPPRGKHATRHVPNHTGYGGYDLCGAIADASGGAS